MMMFRISGAGPVATLLLLPPLEQAARATTGMAAARQYLSFLASRMGSPLIAVDESNQPGATMRQFAANYTNLDTVRYRQTSISWAAVISLSNRKM
jgi:hypothetical protein